MNNKNILKDKEVIKTIYKALDDKFGENITVIDISEVSTLSDYFVITSGSSESQVQALADEVILKLNELDVKVKKAEGLRGGTWILLDFGVAMVHIFSQENRETYNLEKVWSLGTVINIEEF